MSSKPQTRSADVDAQLAAILANLSLASPIERSAPKLLTLTPSDFLIWEPLVKVYILEGGLQPLSHLLAPNLHTLIDHLLGGLTIDRVSIPAFCAAARLYWRLDDISASEAAGILTALKMPDSKVFNSASIENYYHRFNQTLGLHPARFSKLSVKTRIRIFLSGLFPTNFRAELVILDLETWSSVEPALIDLSMAYRSHALIEKSFHTAGHKPSFFTPRPVVSEGKIAASVHPTVQTVRTYGPTCYNCNSATKHHFKDCPQLCLHCQGVPPHRFQRHCHQTSTSVSVDRLVCSHVCSPSILHLPPPPQLTIPSSVVSTSSVLVDSSHLAMTCTNAPSLDRMTPAHYDIIVDSGAVPTFVHNLAYIEQPVFHDSHTSPLPTVSLADGTAVDINASGTFMGMQVDYVPNFPNTLLSVSQYCTPSDSHHEHIALFTATNMYGCTVDPIMRNMLSDLYQYAYNHSMIDLSAKCVDGLYRTNQHTLKSAPASTCNSRHCMMSSYQTVQFASLPELVLFFHRLWQHPSQSKMLDIVRNGLVTNFPAALTPDAILRHFPALCPDCPVGHLSRSTLPRISKPTSHDIGSEIVLDIKGPWTGSDGKPVKSFSGHLYTLTARDRMSEYLWGFPLSDRKNLLKYIIHLHHNIRLHNRVLHVIHCDDEFDQAPIRDYCALHGISMKLCVPYEHGQLGFIERSHRTIQDAVVKSMHNAPHITEQFWAMAYLDTIDKLNIQPCVHNPLTSPYSLWYGHPYDMSVHPMLPFGTLVMAHLPLELQHALSGRSFETFYVRSAHEHKNGLLLFNPVTKRCIVRRTFKALGFSKISSPVYDIDAEFIAPCEESDITYPAEHHSLDMMNDDPVVDLPLSSPIPSVLPLNRHVRFSDVLTYIDNSSPSTDITPVSSRSRIGTTRTDPLQSLSEHHRLALTSATYTPPRIIDHNHFTIQQALRSPYSVELCGAVHDEIASLRKMNAIVNCDIDPKSIPKHQLVRSLLLIDRLFNPDGSFKKNKARIVARGDDWNPLIPFDVL
jgi:hypothetical protein